MAAAGLGFRKSGKSRAKSSTQGLGLPTQVKPQRMSRGSFVDVLVSEEGQQSSSSGPTLPSTTESASWHTDAGSLFTGPATEWFGSVPAYWEQPRAAYYG